MFFTMRDYFVYIMSSQSGVLYVGVTNDLGRRVSEHKAGEVPGFTSKYRVKQLVYYERFTDPKQAIAREKVIKSWRRSKKTALIESLNPHWVDLGETDADDEEAHPPDPSSLRPSG